MEPAAFVATGESHIASDGAVLDATGDSTPVTVVMPDPATTYKEHNGETPHADPALRCGCNVCKQVDGR